MPSFENQLKWKTEVLFVNCFGEWNPTFLNQMEVFFVWIKKEIQHKFLPHLLSNFSQSLTKDIVRDNYFYSKC